MSVVGLIEFPSPSDLAGRIQPISQLFYLSSVTSMHPVVPPIALRATGMRPSEDRASGPKLLPPLTSLCFPCIKEVLFCVCQDAINLGKDKIPGVWWAFCPNASL